MGPILDSIYPLLTSCSPLVSCIRDQNQERSNNKRNKQFSFEQTGGVSWCTIAYWEEKSRVGAQVKCSGDSKSINVASTPLLVPPGEALPLRDLQKENKHPSAGTILTRQKIGMGVTLEREETG